MSAPPAASRPSGFEPWMQRVAGAAACTLPGLLMRMGGGLVAPPVQLVGYGAAVVASAFMLAWACEAAQVDMAKGLVVAIVAFVAILPEYVVEAHFAFTGRADFVTANLTGATRLLLGACIGLPALLALLPKIRRPERSGPLELAPEHRIEVAVLALAALWMLRPVVGGHLTLFDSIVLLTLYAVYLRRVIHSEPDGSEPMGVAAELAALPVDRRKVWVRVLMLYAALVILLTAVPFGDAVLGTGALVGISPYLLLQWMVPIATEVPELVVAVVLLLHGRGGQSVAVLLAGAVSQYTLALGTLPIAFAVGAGTGPLPLAGRERVELLLTIGVALYAVAAVITLRVSRGDASIMLGLFAVQFLLPSVFTRFVLAIAFVVLAVDILVAERRHIRPLLGALRPEASARGDPGEQRVLDGVRGGDGQPADQDGEGDRPSRPRRAVPRQRGGEGQPEQGPGLGPAVPGRGGPAHP
jgi:cation:H+ antiporter